jgi:hypothetical protein
MSPSFSGSSLSDADLASLNAGLPSIADLGNGSLPTDQNAGLPPDLSDMGQAEAPILPALLPPFSQDNSLLQQLPPEQQSALSNYATDHPGELDLAASMPGGLENFAAEAVGADQLGGPLAKEPDVVGSDYKNFTDDLMSVPGNNLRIPSFKKKPVKIRKYRAPKKKKTKKKKAAESCPIK